MDRPIEAFKTRFNKAISAKNIKPTELAEKTGLSKSTISHYMSGYTKPKSDKLFILAKTLGVKEQWLMGYDVPMERNSHVKKNLIGFDAELDEVINIIESAGYLISPSEDLNEIIIKTRDNDIAACMYDYELVGKYKSLQHERIPITAEILVEDSEIQTWINRENAFDYQLKVLGWTYKILVEADPTDERHGRAIALFRNKNISFRATMKDCDSFINDAESFFKERLRQLLRKSTEQLFVGDSIDNDVHSESLVTQNAHVIESETDRATKEQALTLIELQPHRNNSFNAPYFRGGISAGNGIFILGNEATDTLEIPDIPKYSDTDYAVDVNGHSMEPDYMDGDIVLVSQKKEMHPGDVGIFIVDGSAYIKEMGHTELISRNKAFPNIPIEEFSNVVCMGKVIAKLEGGAE